MLKKLHAYFLGIIEFREQITTNPGEDLIPVYDRGRDLAHKLTIRRFETE